MRGDRRRPSYDPRRMRGWRRSRSKARDEAIASRILPVDLPVDVPVEATADVPVDALVFDDLLPGARIAEPPESLVAEPLLVAALDPGVPPLPPAAESAEILRLFEVVTNMCDHVIQYIEADRAERQLMMQTLADLGRAIIEGAAATTAAQTAQISAIAAQTDQLAALQTQQLAALQAQSVALESVAPEPVAPVPIPAPIDIRAERVIGGSMPAGPEPVIDLLGEEPDCRVELTDSAVSSMEIAVEVRGRFGDRWVDGFEICEVMTTPDGPRYRLRRHRDRVVLPELFDATNIRHVETFEQLNGERLNGSGGYWSRS